MKMTIQQARHLMLISIENTLSAYQCEFCPREAKFIVELNGSKFYRCKRHTVNALNEATKKVEHF